MDKRTAINQIQIDPWTGQVRVWLILLELKSGTETHAHFDLHPGSDVSAAVQTVNDRIAANWQASPIVDRIPLLKGICDLAWADRPAGDMQQSGFVPLPPVRTPDPDAAGVLKVN